MPDLDSYAATDDVVLDLKLPGTDEPALGADGVTPIRIYFHGIDTPEYLTARNALINGTRRLGARGKGTYEQEQDLAVEFMAAITRTWSPALPIGGKQLEFSKANAKKLYGASRTAWVRQQADDLLLTAGLRNFTKASAPEA